MAPISPTVRAVARHFLDTELSEDMPMPVGLLVGEQPSAAHNPKLPLWPWPERSAGARLFRLSGMAVTDYLTRLARVNLARRPVAGWDAVAAMGRARALLGDLPIGTRVVVCGARARDAFELGEWFTPRRFPGIPVVAIPHPSGRNHAYNDATVRRTASEWIRWAARV